MQCRLCQGPVRLKWSMPVMRKHEVEYFECDKCGSLQTGEPYWLKEAYAGTGAGYDTGAVQRNINLALSMHAILDLLRFDKTRACLDFGGGMGMYARMMRDRGYNYWAVDLHNSLYFMDRFVGDRPSWSLISAFEVAEHLPAPGETWAALFAKQPDYLFFTTDLYEGQGREWPYLAPEEGQHVFFYSRKALTELGRAHSYAFAELGYIKVFARPPLPALSTAVIDKRAMELFVQHQRSPWEYAAKDNQALRDNV